MRMNNGTNTPEEKSPRKKPEEEFRNVDSRARAGANRTKRTSDGGGNT